MRDGQLKGHNRFANGTFAVTMCPVCFARTSKQTDVAINTAEAADAIVERNRWRETIWQKVKDCEAAEPLVQLIRMGSRYQPCGLTAEQCHL